MHPLCTDILFRTLCNVCISCLARPNRRKTDSEVVKGKNEKSDLISKEILMNSIASDDRILDNFFVNFFISYVDVGRAWLL
jgi:hypothetical protein